MSIYCAREFSALDIQTIGDLIAQDPKLQRSALSRKLCQLWGWTRPNGDSKDMTCRVALPRMQADGLIELPPSRIGVVRKRAHFAPTAASALFQPRTSGFTRFAKTSPPYFASRRYGFTEYLLRFGLKMAVGTAGVART